MVEMDEENIRKSFAKVKEDIIALKAEISQNKAILEGIKNKINSLSNENKQQESKSSIGNEGVYSFIHSTGIHSTGIHSLNPLPPNLPQQLELDNLKQIDSTFKNLTHQEFLTFMFIYQLEDDLNRKTTYSEIAKKLNLSEGCIRTYISQLIKNGLPITKEKINNRLIVLGINSHFRNLGLKNRLFTILNKLDPTQTRFDNF